MDRLTTHDPNRRLVACRANYESWNAIYDRLAAYEDTWMTPESIIAAQKTLRCFDRIGIKRGNEIVDAELEGRLIVMPCKVGDTVWYIPSGTRKIYSGICHCVSIQQGGVNIHLYDFDGDAATYPASRVFLTREEAEAALGGEGDG